MNKKDLLPIILLALLIPAWVMIDRYFIAPKFPAPAPVEQTAQTVDTPAAETTAPAAATLDTAPENTEPQQPPAEEQVVTLQNGQVKLELTSLGGGIKSATLFEYPELNEPESPPVILDFSKAPALAYEGLPAISGAAALNIETTAENSAVLTKALGNGVSFQRTITLNEGYLVAINDRFINSSETPWALPALTIPTGRMKNPTDVKGMKGMSILGADSYTAEEGVTYWAKPKIIGGSEINKLYKNANKALSVDATPADAVNQPVEWVSAKNKFFTQILRPKEASATMSLRSSRDPSAKGVMPQDIAATLTFKSDVIAGGGSHAIDYTYYIGPKHYDTLKAAGHNMEDVMEFVTTGFWSFMNWMMEPARKFLLWSINTFQGLVSSYGIAIILVTLLIRILFWPLTHKSTESMKRMQELQPEIKAIQEKYKKDPQRMQQETMLLYREKKVNPMGGCLPMFIQIPVFIALFTVLRNAIELRYASFLWIADMSMPENLFAGKIPFVGSLNILPIFMSLSMIWQQKLTPTPATTPEQQQQQKMMMFMMPIMMLVFFYNMPSGLVLYWTTSNLLMIGQTSLRNLKKKKAAA